MEKAGRASFIGSSLKPLLCRSRESGGPSELAEALLVVRPMSVSGLSFILAARFIAPSRVDIRVPVAKLSPVVLPVDFGALLGATRRDLGRSA